MNGSIPAGGPGTCRSPLTNVTAIHPFPLGKEPMIFNQIRQVLPAGITFIPGVTGKLHRCKIIRLLSSGSGFNCKFPFRIHEMTEGIADELSLAEVFARSERVAVILMDIILAHSISGHVTLRNGDDR